MDVEERITQESTLGFLTLKNSSRIEATKVKHIVTSLEYDIRVRVCLKISEFVCVFYSIIS